jgi:hypothetical protein
MIFVTNILWTEAKQKARYYMYGLHDFYDIYCLR